MSSVGQMVDDDAIREYGDEGSLGDAMSVKVKGMEGTEHECSFCCKCWTDE